MSEKIRSGYDCTASSVRSAAAMSLMQDETLATAVSKRVATSRRDWTALLLTGRTVHITMAAPVDLPTVRAFYERLDDASSYTRFFGIRRHIPIDELRRVVGADPAHVTLLAWSDGWLVGIGEYVVVNEGPDAEVAFAVADDHHREGIATLLLERLAVIAHERGLLRFTAMVLRGNHDMRLVFRTVGLTEHTEYDDGAVLVTLDLSSVVRMLAAADSRSANARRCAG